MVVAVGFEVDERVTAAAPTLRHALSEVAGTAVDQARDLAVAQLDRFADRLAERLHERLEVAAKQPPAANRAVTPVLVGAIAGVVVAWLLANRPPKT